MSVVLASPTLLGHISVHVSAPVPKTRSKNWIDVSIVTVNFLAKALTSKDSVIHLLVIQSLIKQTITYKSQLTSCPCSIRVTPVV